MTERRLTPPFSWRAPIAQANGNATPEFMRYLNDMWQALGGTNASPTQQTVTVSSLPPIAIPADPAPVMPVAVSEASAQFDILGLSASPALLDPVGAPDALSPLDPLPLLS